MVKIIKCLTLGFNSIDPKIYRIVIIDAETGEAEDIYNSSVLEELKNTEVSSYLTSECKNVAIKKCSSSIYNNEKIAEKFLDMIESQTVFAGVGCKYDVECLLSIAKKCKNALNPKVKLLDLIKVDMNRNAYKNLSYTYMDMCSRYGATVRNRYDALEYAKNSKHIFEEMYKKP